MNRVRIVWDIGVLLDVFWDIDGTLRYVSTEIIQKRLFSCTFRSRTCLKSWGNVQNVCFRGVSVRATLWNSRNGLPARSILGHCVNRVRIFWDIGVLLDLFWDIDGTWYGMDPRKSFKTFVIVYFSFTNLY